MFLMPGAKGYFAPGIVRILNLQTCHVIINVSGLQFFIFAFSSDRPLTGQAISPIRRTNRRPEKEIFFRPPVFFFDAALYLLRNALFAHPQLLLKHT